MKRIIGITGGISSGKSTIVKYIRDLGYEVIDADEVTHNLYKKGAQGYNVVKNEFGDYYVTNESVDRVALGNLIYSNKGERMRLNALIHPVIYSVISKMVNEFKEGILFLDIPLLYEASFDDLCDDVILVYTDRKTQISRLMARDNIDYNMAEKKISSQMSLDEKRKKAKYVIDNSSSLEESYSMLSEILKEIK